MCQRQYLISRIFKLFLVLLKRAYFPRIAVSHQCFMLRVDDPRSEARVLHELTQNKMAEDAESNIAIRFVDENDYIEISAKAVSAKRKLKKNRPTSLV